MTTDNEGHFQFNVYTGGEAIFWILPKDYAPSTHVAHTKRGDFGRFVLEKGLVLKGHVVDIDGKPLPNVWVNAEIRGGPAKQSLGMSVFDKLARAALSDRNGEFRMAPLPAGVYDLIEADYPRGGLGGDNTVHPLPAVFLNRQITLDQKEAAKSIEVRAVPHVVMGGQFFDSSERPASGVELRLWGSTKGPKYWDTCWFGQAQIDERGKFTAQVPKGVKVRLSWIDDAQHVLRTRVSKNAASSNGQEVDLGIIDRDKTDIALIRYMAPTLLVRAVAEDGKTIKGFQAKLEYLPGHVPTEGEYLRTASRPAT